MNLETKLTNSLNEILKSSGYIFEIINNNKKSSNIITGTNNQLITPSIIAQLSNNITKFDDLLDETVSKLNDSRWCIENILDYKQKQEELKLKEEEDRQKRIKEEEEKKRKDEEEAKAKAAEEARIKKEQEEQEERKVKEIKERKQTEEDFKMQQNPPFNSFMSPGFDFNDIPTDTKLSEDMLNPSDILSTINFNSEGKNDKSKGDTNGNAMDLDMNNILANDESILDGLNMSLLDQGGYGSSNNLGTTEGDGDFDVDSFLNQFGGSD